MVSKKDLSYGRVKESVFMLITAVICTLTFKLTTTIIGLLN